ncbi:MAG: MFS transporter [Proteobacteria bacterium]|nr:MFS transporter [Pseudomonadota bacterium]
MKSVYYGWWLVAGLFVVLTVSSGFGFYNLSVYMNVFARTHGFAISDISVAVSLFFVVGGITGIWVARLLDQFDVRLIMIIGAIVAGLALGVTGSVTSLWQLYLLFTLFGIGNTGVSIIVSTTLVTRWFPGRNRSVALSIASTGLSMGGVVLTPASAKILSHYALDQVMPWFGLAFFVLIAPIAWWIVKDRPSDADLHRTRQTADPGPLWTYSQAVRNRFFILLTAAYVLCMGSQVGGISHLYNRVYELIGASEAAWAVQALTIMSITGRFVGGWLVTLVPIRTFTLINAAGQVGGLTLVGSATSTTQVLVGAGLFGASMGNLLMLQPLWLAEAFGIRAYARIFSVSNAVTVAGVAGGPILLGVLYDLQGYNFAYLTAASISVVALILMSLAGAGPGPNQHR